MDIIVEPIVTLAHSESNVDNADIINEDSVFFEYDLPVLFKADPFTQYDLIEQGSRAVAGMRTAANFRNGVRLRGTVGRRWRSETDPAFSIGSNLDGTQSDYIIGGGLDLGTQFSFDSGIRLDDDGDLLKIETTGSVEFWRFDVNATYFRLDEDISFNPLAPETTEGLALNAKIRLTDSTKLLYLVNRNLTRELNARQQIALQWEDDCSFFRIGWAQSEISDRGIGNSESITFEFGFKTLGQVTNSDFD
jgi:LPS-assembly protein